MLSAGRLRHRVTLQSKSASRDGYGGETITWVDLATVWADCSPLSGREYLAARVEVAETLIKIRIRWRADVSTTCRAVWEGRAYDIEAAFDTGGRHEELVLMCKAVA
jgi:SPP1 family predicted phage head-tail adaptor